MRALTGSLPAILGACTLATAALGVLGGELDEAEFQRLHALLRPAADATWRTIPWRLSLLEAQGVAARENKPIFIWAMDGHPLGCT